MKINKWIEPHAHIGGKDITPEMMVKGFHDFFENMNDIDFTFIASPDGDWIEKVRMGNVLEAHELLYQVVKEFPNKLYGGCMINANYLDESLKTMDKCFGEWDFVMLGELVTYLMEYKMNQPNTLQLVKKAIEYDKPIHVHVSTSNAKPQGNYESGEEELNDLLDVVEKFPEGKFIMAHGVGAPQIKPYVIDTYLKIINSRFDTWPKNLWIEIMHFHGDVLNSVYNNIPVEKITSGMDYMTRFGLPFPPYGSIFMPQPVEPPYPANIQSLAGFLEKAGFNENEIKQIAYKNAIELYKLPTE